MFTFLISAEVSYAKDGPHSKVLVAPKPAWVKQAALTEPTQIKADDASNGFLFLLKDYQVNFLQQTHYYHLVKKIYSETGVQNGSEIEYSYDPSYQKLIFHEVKIIREGKELNRLDVSKFKVFQRESSKESYLYDESLTALLILDDIRAGDLVEYSFSCVGRNPIYQDKYFASFYLQDYDPFEKLFIRVITSADKNLNITYENTDSKPKISTENDKIMYEWDLIHVPGLAVDADVPQWYDPYPHVWLSEFNSWSEVKNWALTLYQTPLVMNLLSEKAAQIKAMNALPEKRLEAALRFVQDEIRYTGLESGISGYKPHSPERIMKQRFGDCKDKSLLLCALLRQLDIEAYPALVHSTFRQEIKKWAPTPSSFNHCIVQVQFKGENYWYDPTIANQRGTYETIYCPNYRTALVIKKDAEGLVDIPINRYAKIRVNENFVVDTIEGTVQLSIETQYIGYEADAQRQYYANSNLKEMEKGYLNYYAKRYAKIQVSKPLKTTDDSQSNIYTTYENYKIENFFYASDSSQPENLECALFPQMLRDKILIPSNSIRTMPVGLAFPTDYEHITRVCLPEHWSIKPEKKTIADDMVTFSREIRYEPDTITIQYKYKILADQVSNSQVAAYTKKQNQIIDLLGYGLTYTVTATPTEDFQLNWMLVLMMLLFGIIAGFLVYQLYYYDPQPEQLTGFREEIGGWLIACAIGIIISPIQILITLLRNDYFNLTNWENIAYSASQNYSPSLVMINIAALFFNIASLLVSLLVIILFFNKRSSLPRVMSVYLAASLLYTIIEAALLASLDISPGTEAIRYGLYTIIWVSYFNISKRVKRTFVYTLKPNETMTEVYRFRV
ncbi:MAG: DUF3857 domain-containing protein [Bacteroidota bacterium]